MGGEGRTRGERHRRHRGTDWFKVGGCRRSSRGTSKNLAAQHRGRHGGGEQRVKRLLQRGRGSRSQGGGGSWARRPRTGLGGRAAGGSDEIAASTTSWRGPLRGRLAHRPNGQPSSARRRPPRAWSSRRIGEGMSPGGDCAGDPPPLGHRRKPPAAQASEPLESGWTGTSRQGTEECRFVAEVGAAGGAESKRHGALGAASGQRPARAVGAAGGGQKGERGHGGPVQEAEGHSPRRWRISLPAGGCRVAYR